MSAKRARPASDHPRPDSEAGPYDPLAVEPRRYQEWLERGYFHAPVDPSRAPFCIMMPLPNITGTLHMGHALNHTIQDLLTRWKRMQGYNAMWLPGTDHASIGTHVVMERALAQEGKTRFDLGREKFLEYAWQWKEKYGGLIYSQIRRMGSGCDWDRVTFTMDPGYHDAVIECFLRLYEKGAIYYGKRMINWCPKDLTSVSDLEVDYQTVQSHLWYVRYQGADGGEGIVIATQRPETILADVAVAVHPEDERYRAIVGREVVVPIVNRRVPVIADPRVDPAFGTGALKITPGHDPTDYAIGADHHLPVLVVLDERGRMTEETGRYAAMDRFAARDAVARDLEEAGLVERKDAYATNVGLCDRCKTVLEPYITDQWFVRMADLAKPAIDAVRTGRVRFHPARWADVYLAWMENIHDWNISRRLWWGHRIPVYHCQDCRRHMAARTAPDRCPGCGGRRLHQEEQILDTWFSSAAWPFATLGWPAETPDLAYFYPTSVLVTARDIIFLWVARMIMFGIEFMGDVPFTDVYINPTVLNIEGRRMSKSLGTGLDPLDYVEQGYGADAMRYALTLRCSQGQQDLRFGEKMLEDVRNFNNKIWNASRFVRMHLDGFEPAAGRGGSPGLIDRWILSRYARLTREVTAAFESFDFDKAARALYDFVWLEFCDWYLELAKVDLYREGGDPGRRRVIQHTLWTVFEGTLRLLHPIMPHLTEEVWQSLPHDGPTIMTAPWPRPDAAAVDERAETEMATLIAVVRAIRSMRADLGLSPSASLSPVLRGSDVQAALLDAHHAYVAALARAPGLSVAAGAPRRPGSVGTVADGVEVVLEIAEADRDRARKRLTGELTAARADLDRTSRKLGDPSFVARAPADVVAEERRRQQDLEARTTVLQGYLAALR